MQQTFLPTGRQGSNPITTTDCSHVACYTTLSTDYMLVLQQYLDSSQMPRITEYLTTVPALFVDVCCIGDSSQEPVPQIVPKPLFYCFTFSRHIYNFNRGFKIYIFSFKDIQIPSKHNKIYYTLPLLDYMFRLLRVIIRPSSELIQDYLIPSALWDPVALTIVGAVVLWVHVCYYSVYSYLCYYITM